MRGDAVLLDVVADREQPDEDAEQQDRPQRAENQFATEGMVTGGFGGDVAGNQKGKGREDDREQERPDGF